MLAIIVPPFNRVSAQQPDATAQCRPAGALVTIPELPEASGVAVSRRIPGRLWSHNDSGQPILTALDAHGRVTGQLRITGATVDDWEAVAVGACPGGSCVYVGDIGDNDARRKRITIYRFPEPAETDTAAAATDAFHATYPDGAHDAEALLVMPDQTIFIVTKGDTGAVALYRFPATSDRARATSSNGSAMPARTRPARKNGSPMGRSRRTVSGWRCAPATA